MLTLGAIVAIVVTVPIGIIAVPVSLACLVRWLRERKRTPDATERRAKRAQRKEARRQWLASPEGDNFTFSRSQETLPSRRAFSLSGPHTKFTRSFSFSGNPNKKVAVPRKRHKSITALSKTIMGEEKFDPPSGPPPWYKPAQSTAQDEQIAPPPGPPPGHAGHISFAPTTRPGRTSNYASPPSSSQEEYFTPPPGPPPSYIARQSSDTFAPPPGPPPSHSKYSTNDETYAPPQGPPPSKSGKTSQDQPPGYFADPHSNYDWTVVPDTSLLPPPPTLGYDTSPTANASEDEGAYAYQWCKANPLWTPRPLAPDQAAAVRAGHIALMRPPEFAGELVPNRQAPGTWKARTGPNQRDACLMTALPVCSALADLPLRTGRPKTIYFEVKVHSMGGHGGWRGQEADAGIAIGFVAPPYPTWRLPGWQRGSLGVHGDDGRKYVNDTFGGVDFTTAFLPGQTVGIGMRFSPPGQNQQYGGRRMDIEVFFTRNGRKDGGWDLHEEMDERAEGGTIGLEGECDLFAAVGVFGSAEFDVKLNPRDWMYRIP